jgi:hypothetical protein
MYSLVESAKVAGADPVAYLLEVVTRARRRSGAVLLPAEFQTTADVEKGGPQLAPLHSRSRRTVDAGDRRRFVNGQSSRCSDDDVSDRGGCGRGGQSVVIEIVDSIEFPIGRQFWKMVEENDAKNSAASEVRVDEQGHLFYRAKPVELGLAVGHLVYVLRWRDWIVAVGSAADKTRSTIKGPIWYLFWFGKTTLKGSYRQVSDVVALPLRIYTK